MKIRINMGVVDRISRLAVAAVLLLAGMYFHWHWASVVGAVLAVTAVVGVCPAYLPFQFSTVGRPRGKLR